LVALTFIAACGSGGGGGGSTTVTSLRPAVQDYRDSTGKLTDHWVYNYDSNGYNLTVFDYDSSNYLRGYDIYEYNSQGQQIRSSIYSGSTNTLLAYITYEYSTNGYLNKHNLYWISNGVYTSISYALYYFTGSQKVKVERYDSPTNTFLSSMTFYYDESGNRTKCMYLDGSYNDWSIQSPAQTVVTLYDSSGRITATRTITWENRTNSVNFLDYANF
jgi:hypothetical protein